MFIARRKYPGIIARGLWEAIDFYEGDLTNDDAPHVLDLSAIVPAGSKWVWIQAGIVAGTPNVHFKCAKTEAHVYTGAGIFAQVASSQITQLLLVECTSDRKITYWSSVTPGNDYLTLIIVGWSP